MPCGFWGCKRLDRPGGGRRAALGQPDPGPCQGQVLQGVGERFFQLADAVMEALHVRILKPAFHRGVSFVCT